MTYDHISIDTNWNKWIRKQRQKTKNMYNIPLMEIPLKIIDKYKSHPRCQEKNVLLPVLCNQKTNAYMKEITDLCGINKQVSTRKSKICKKNLCYLLINRLRAVCFFNG